MRVDADRSDRELLAATSDDPEAFGIFFDRHSRDVLRFFRRRVQDPEAAADLTAETFATALADLAAFDSERGTPTQWLFGIARNLHSRYWRTQRVDRGARERLGIPPRATEGDPEAAAALERVEIDIDGPGVRAALDSLPDPVREAVELRVLESLTYEDIADRTGCKVGTARVRVFRGLRVLRESLGA